MQTISRESILEPDEIAEGRELYCLSCRHPLGNLALEDRLMPDGSAEVVATLSICSDNLRDLQSSHESLTVSCDCGCRSTFHRL